MLNQSEGIAAPTNATDELSTEQAILRMMGEETPDETAQTEEPEETEEVETEETEESAETEETNEEESEDAEASDLVDLDNLTEEQWELVRTKLKSGAAARIAKLTAIAKAKDETIAALRSQAPQQALPDAVESRFLKGVDSPEKLAEKVTELKGLVKDTERILDDHEDHGLDDPIEVGDRSYTKRQLKALRKEAREALDEAVPYKQHQFAQAQAIEQQAQAMNAQARLEVPEIEDTESDIGKTFKILNESDLFKEIREKVPTARPGIELLLAHFCRSKHGKATVKPAATGKTTKVNPPSTPSGAAATPQAKPAGKEKLTDARKAQAEKSGRTEDWEKWLESRI